MEVGEKNERAAQLSASVHLDDKGILVEMIIILCTSTAVEQYTTSFVTSVLTVILLICVYVVYMHPVEDCCICIAPLPAATQNTPDMSYDMI